MVAVVSTAVVGDNELADKTGWLRTERLGKV